MHNPALEKTLSIGAVVHGATIWLTDFSELFEVVRVKGSCVLCTQEDRRDFISYGKSLTLGASLGSKSEAREKTGLKTSGFSIEKRFEKKN